MGRKLKTGFVEAVLLAVAAGVILFAGWAMARNYDAQRAYTPTNLIRLHIIGNSDDLQDQEVKLKVRDALMSTFGGRLLNVNDVEEAEKTLSALLPEIEDMAKGCLADAGVAYNVRARLKTVFFPDKYYEAASGETVFLPEGPYKALQVILGAGKGQNWWCVMYPPLCYVDIVRKNVVGDDSGQEVEGRDYPASVYAAGLIDEDSLHEVPVEVRFLILDILRKTKEALPSLFTSLTLRFTYNMCPGTVQK